MKRIAKLLSVMLLVAAFIGCESDSSSDSEDVGESLIRTRCVVQTRTPVALQEGDIGFYDCGTFRIVVTDVTRIFHTRDSCSGLFEADFRTVESGDILYVDYFVKDADYMSSPTILRPVNIEGYRPDCLTNNLAQVQSDESCNTSCPNEFFN